MSDKNKGYNVDKFTIKPGDLHLVKPGVKPSSEGERDLDKELDDLIQGFESNEKQE